MILEPAFRQDMARAKKLVMAPTSMTMPIQLIPRFSLSVVSGAVKLVEGGIVVGQRVRFDVGDEDKERAGDQQAGDHGAGDHDQRLLGLFAEGGGAFKADETEDGHHDAQADVLEPVADVG